MTIVLWLIVTVALLVWNAIYCARKIISDFRGPTPASGVWGLFALAGALSTIAIAFVSVLVAGSRI